MKIKFVSLGSLLLVVGLTFSLARNPQQSSNACGFAVEGQSVQPTINGPDDLVPLVYVVEQPDSPIDVVSVDLTGMWLSISNERHTERNCAKYRVRNRSNRTIQGFEIIVMLSTIAGAGGGFGTLSSSALLPEQAVDLASCGSGGEGSAQDNYVRLLVYVEKVDFDDCQYRPSLRIPRSLRVHPVW